MSKRKSKREKDLTRLRRENEILRAQLSQAKKWETPAPSSNKITQKESIEEEFIPVRSDTVYLKADLSRALLLTTSLIFLLSILYYTQPQWPEITNIVLSKF